MSRSRQVTGTASVVLAPNPGPMTLEGTNSWVLRAPDQESCIVVDPGPLHEGHLAALVACGPVAVILLTHGHADHSAGAARLASLTGAAVRANTTTAGQQDSPSIVTLSDGSFVIAWQTEPVDNRSSSATIAAQRSGVRARAAMAASRWRCSVGWLSRAAISTMTETG